MMIIVAKMEGLTIVLVAADDRVDETIRLFLGSIVYLKIGTEFQIAIFTGYNNGAIWTSSRSNDPHSGQCRVRKIAYSAV